ncbi:MAG: hypothetical protein JW969_20435 [Spirochaetales bacterium]|nr:hypothetical protein [Spirochaetales bacterium]
MKRLTVPLFLLLLLPHGVIAQQAEFSDTVMDFKSRVIDFREDGLTGCIRGNVLVNPSPADLKPGDIFIDADGKAKKVAAVERVGNDIYIDTVEPYFEEVFLYAEIPDQVIVFDEENFLPETLAVNSNTPVQPPDSRGTFNVNFEKEIYNKPPSTVTINAGATLTSSISIGFKAPTYVKVKIRTWKFWQWKISFKQQKGYIQASLNYDLTLTGGITFSLKKTMESNPILLYGFGTPTSGISANLGLMTKTILEGKIELSLPVTFNVSGNTGAKCTLEGQVPVMWPTSVSRWGSSAYSVTIDPTLTAEASLKQKLYLGGEVTLVGIKITEFEAGGGPYIKLTGTLSGSIGYSSASGLIGPSWSASATGEIGVFMDITGKIFDGKWSFTLMSFEFPIYTLEFSTGCAYENPVEPAFIPAVVNIDNPGRIQ